MRNCAARHEAGRWSTALRVAQPKPRRHTGLGDGDGLAAGDLAGGDAPDADAALVLVVVQVGDQQLKRRLDAHHRRRHLQQDHTGFSPGCSGFSPGYSGFSKAVQGFSPAAQSSARSGVITGCSWFSPLKGHSLAASAPRAIGAAPLPAIIAPWLQISARVLGSLLAQHPEPQTHLADDALEQRLQVLRQGLGVVAGDAVGAAGVHHGEVALLVGGAQIDEEVEGGVNDEVRPAAQSHWVS